MFKSTSFFIVIKDESVNYEIKRLNLNREAQDSLCSLFSEALHSIIGEDFEVVDFQVGYNPDINQVQKINGYNIDDSIINALREPTSIDVFKPEYSEYPNIKAIFTGIIEPEILIAFQKFNKSQYLSNRGLSFIHCNGTLRKVNEFGISVNTQLDCVYKNNNLLFKSYYNARQVFDLSMYYRSASDQDIRSFLDNDKICVSDQDDFIENADSWIRKKIALIQDSGVLQNYEVREIVNIATDYNVEIKVTNINGVESIILPDEKKEMKEVLKFLDEDIYRGPLSNIMYETNSKRKIRR